MGKISDSFKSIFKHFSSNLLFFTSILSLSIVSFSFFRISAYQDYAALTSKGLGSFELLGPYGAIVSCIIVFIFSLISAINLRKKENFELKSEISNANIFINLASISTFFIIACVFMFMSVHSLYKFESDISINYCNYYSFCKEKWAREDEIRKQNDGSIIIGHSTCPYNFTSICLFYLSK